MLARTPYLRIAFWLAACVAMTMAFLPNPPRIEEITNDKLQHMAAFAAITLLGRLAYPRIRDRVLLMLLLGLGALIEVVQAVPALHRDADIRDFIADGIAIIVTLILYRALGIRSAEASTPRR